MMYRIPCVYISAYTFCLRIFHANPHSLTLTHTHIYIYECHSLHINTQLLGLIYFLTLTSPQMVTGGNFNGAKSCVIASDTDDENSRASSFMVCNAFLGEGGGGGGIKGEGGGKQGRNIKKRRRHSCGIASCLTNLTLLL